MPANPVEPDPTLLTWLCTKASRNLPRNLLQNLLRNPVKPNRAPHQSFPHLLRNLLRTLLNLTWLCTKASQTFSGIFSGTLLNLTWLHQSLPDLLRNFLRNLLFGTCWTWLGFAPRLPGTFSRTFSGTLLNLTWLCTKASAPDSSPEPSPEPCWTWPGSAPKPPKHSPVPSPQRSPEPCWTDNHWRLLDLLWNLLRNLPRNPVEPDLALPQSLPDLLWNLLRNLFRNPVEPDLALQNLLRNPVEPDLALHQSLPDHLRNLRNLPRWTWPGACTGAHRGYSGLKTPLAYAAVEKDAHWKLRRNSSLKWNLYLSHREVRMLQHGAGAQAVSAVAVAHQSSNHSTLNQMGF